MIRLHDHCCNAGQGSDGYAAGSHRTLPWDKLKEGFPPAYTSWVAADLLRAVL